MKKEVQKKEYDKAFIYTVLRALWTEKLDYKAAEARYKVSYYTIIQWKRKFFEEREMILSTNLSSVIRSDDDDKDSQITKLKKAVEVCNMHITTLETMIDIAEKTLKVDIRKKSGTKQ